MNQIEIDILFGVNVLEWLLSPSTIERQLGYCVTRLHQRPLFSKQSASFWLNEGSIWYLLQTCTSTVINGRLLGLSSLLSRTLRIENADSFGWEDQGFHSVVFGEDVRDEMLAQNQSALLCLLCVCSTMKTRYFVTVHCTFYGDRLGWRLNGGDKNEASTAIQHSYVYSIGITNYYYPEGTFRMRLYLIANDLSLSRLAIDSEFSFCSQPRSLCQQPLVLEILYIDSFCHSAH